MSDLYVGLGIPQLLEAVLKLLPLDTYVPSPVQNHKSNADLVKGFVKTNAESVLNLFPQAAVMDLVDSDKCRGLSVPVWDTYMQLLDQAGCQVKQPDNEYKTQANKT